MCDSEFEKAMGMRPEKAMGTLSNIITFLSDRKNPARFRTAKCEGENKGVAPTLLTDF